MVKRIQNYVYSLKEMRRITKSSHKSGMCPGVKKTFFGFSLFWGSPPLKKKLRKNKSEAGCGVRRSRLIMVIGNDRSADRFVCVAGCAGVAW